MSDFEVVKAVHGIVERLYGGTRGRAMYRMRLAPGLLHQFRRFYDENGYVLEGGGFSAVVSDKAFITARELELRGDPASPGADVGPST